ncbi:UNVERIFIED_CONTAM: Retrovirus-related Pol polyprotein from transposon RE2 [Sesamum calycinum]|uniref:Retrovirus-related Pol polyprotein from transposon RE2 n=1 Tax=Sesamum calycinum TaxID=2727403 RepID=A0AAW2M3W3_9LAMI
MLNAKVASTPFPSGLHLTHDEGALLQFPDRYRRLVGRLLYLSFTRPDLSFPVQQLSQYIQHPRTSHWDALHVLRYLKDSRRSITGFYVFLGGSLISWKTKKQATVSRSSAEVEYRSMASTVCDLMWISYLLHDFLVPVQRPIPFWCDNKVALHITANPVFHERTKHLNIDCHLVRDQFKCSFIAPSFIREPDQPADFFTKALPVSVFARLLSKLGLCSQSLACGGAVENSSSSSSPLLEVHTFLEVC